MVAYRRRSPVIEGAVLLKRPPGAEAATDDC